MAMNFPGGYKPHNDSLEYFAERFNNIVIDDLANVVIVLIRKETYKNDGSIIALDKGLAMGLDWEQRQKYYPTYGQFEKKQWGLGQFNTKLVKDEIHISMQCSTDETGLLVGFHQDFKRLANVDLPSESKKNRTELMSNTQHYREFDISTDEGILEFKKMVARAFKLKEYNHIAFVS